MQKSILFLILFLFNLAAGVNGQSYCGSVRFDQEVFTAVNETPNVTYGSSVGQGGGTTILKMDIYEPDSDTAAIRPLIIWAHGGSFVAGTRTDADIVELCRSFARRGYVCASIEYRLGVAFPPSVAGVTQAVWRAVHDMKAAVRFFRQDAATANTYKIDPDFIVAGGSSAGGFTSLHLAYLDEVSEIPAEVDTMVLGGMEGESGNPGYSSEVSAVVNLCGALGDKTYIKPMDVPLCNMHGTNDGTVPYATDIILYLGIFPIMSVDGSYSLSAYADSIGMTNQMYTYFGADHVPYYSNTSYMDTTVRFVSNFLYSQLGCTPSDPNPLPNTFNINTAVNEIERSFEMYPNPATTDLVVELKNGSEKISSVLIYDLLGKKVLSQKTGTSKSIIDVSGLSGGSYFVSIQIGEKVEVRKLIRN